jgi:hypothetical protein
MAKKSGDYIEKWCLECNGEGMISRCCGDYVDGNKCACCGRFCKADVCCDCEGAGYLRFAKDDEVEVFVCVYSPEYLKELLYRPKKYGDAKTYRGVITKIFPDDNRAEIKLQGKRNKVVVDIDELSVY